MMTQLVKLSLKVLINLATKFVLLLLRVGTALMRKWMARSGDCGESLLACFCCAASSAGFAGAVIPALSCAPPLSGICLSLLCSFQIALFFVGKLTRYLADLEAVRVMLFITEADLKKIGADRRVDCFCENSWRLIVRVGFVVPLCLAHYVWQSSEIQATKVEIGFVALFITFQLLQLSYWSVLTRLHDVSTMFEIYVFNAQNGLKKKWQSSVLCRVLSHLTSVQGVLSALHSNQRELTVTYNFLIFSILTSYTIVRLGQQIEHSSFYSSKFCQLIFIVMSENDLRVMWHFNKSTHWKIFHVKEMLTRTTREHIRSIYLWKEEYQELKNFLRIKYLRTCLAHTIAMSAAAYAVSSFLNSQPVSERPIDQFGSPDVRSNQEREPSFHWISSEE